MKIFYATSVLGDIGGSEVYTRDLLKELISRGHELCVFTSCKYKLKGAQMHYVPVFGHHAFHKFQAPFALSKAFKAAKEFEPDIVQSHSNSVMGWIGSRVRKKQNVPHVLLIESISSHNHNVHTKTIFEMEKRMLPRLDYDKIIVWTKLMKDKFLVPWGVEEKKIEIIPPAVNINVNEFETNASEITDVYGKHLITTMKSLWSTSAKGVEYIIEAMPLVFEKHPEYKYVIFGGGKEKPSLEKKVKKMGLSDKILFHGYIQPDKWNSVAKATTVAPHSFIYELSISMSLMEYLARGVPCVVTDIGSAKEIVKDSALVVKPQDPVAIAKGINKLIEDKKLRQELGKKAKALVREKYSMKHTVDRLEEIYSKLSKKRV